MSAQTRPDGTTPRQLQNAQLAELEARSLRRLARRREGDDSEERRQQWLAGIEQSLAADRRPRAIRHGAIALLLLFAAIAWLMAWLFGAAMTAAA